MDPIVAMLVSGAVVVAIFVRHHVWSDARRTRRVLRKARVTRIADLVDGQLQCIVGAVEVDAEPVLALMSRRLCVAFETVVQIYGGRGPTESISPTHVDVTRRMVSFFVVDRSGRARIDAPQAALSHRPVARGERFEERTIEPGMTIRLVGSARLEPVIGHGERGFRDGAFSATITGTAKFPLLVDVET